MEFATREQVERELESERDDVREAWLGLWEDGIIVALVCEHGTIIWQLVEQES